MMSLADENIINEVNPPTAAYVTFETFEDFLQARELIALNKKGKLDVEFLK